MTAHPSTCVHPSFRVGGNVDRTVDDKDQLLALRLHVSVVCEACQTPMWFPGHATGSSYAVAATDPSGKTLTVPIVPVGQRFVPDPRLASAVTRNTDLLKGQS